MISIVSSSCFHGWAASLAVLLTVLTAPVAKAESFDGYTLMGRYTPPSAGPFQDAFDTLADGRVVMVAANEVFIETSVGSRVFRSQGQLTGEGAPVEYPAFVRVSPDSTHLAVGNNVDSVGVFTMDGLRGQWFPVGHFDADWLDDRHLFIRAGQETVTLLDTQSQPQEPVNPVIIENCPVASGIVLDDDGNLYTGNGFGKEEHSDTGWIMFFSFADWSAVLRGAPPLDFEEDGTLVADLLSASSLGFDQAGHLHVGGGDFASGDRGYAGLINAKALADAIEGKGPVDPEDPEQVRKFDPDKKDPANWYDVTVVDAISEFLIRDAKTSTIYVHGLKGGITCDKIKRFKARCRPGGPLRFRVRLRSDDHDGSTMYVTIDNVPMRATVKRKNMKSRLRRPESGQHSVALVDPAECLEPIIVNCK